MKEKHPLEPIIDEIGRILQQFHEEKEKPITGEIDQELAELLVTVEMRVAAAREAFELALKDQGMTKEEVQETMRKREFLPSKDRDLLDRLERMGKEAKQIYFALGSAVNKNRALTARTGKRVSSKKAAGPRLGIGFRKGWKAL